LTAINFKVLGFRKQTFQIKKLKVKVTASRNVSVIKRYKSGTDELTEFKVGANHPSAERNM